MNHGELLKQLRNNRKMSQQELSADISSQAALSRMEVSGNIPSYILINYLQRLDIHPTEFFMMAENSDFIDSKSFGKKFRKALFDKDEMTELVTEKMTLYQETGILHHKIDAYRLQALFYFLRNLPLPNEDEITSTLREYLLSIDTWFISDVILYSQVLFLFDANFIRANHAKMLKSLDNLPFSSSWQYSNEMNYAELTTILAFRRRNWDDAAFYLKTCKTFLTNDSRSLGDRIYYSIYSKLLELRLNFDQAKYDTLVSEMNIIKTYGYEYEYHQTVILVETTLADYLPTK